VGDWYTIGLVLGLALGIGVALSGVLAANTGGLVVALLTAAALGAALGYAVGDTAELVAGIAGALVGTAAASVVVRGALRRGGTRMGVGAFVVAAGLLIALVSFVPVVGYLAVIAVPLLAARMRAREAERFAGLRTLAK
jgi:hypothetical protein